jgi:hypothetical protein
MDRIKLWTLPVLWYTVEKSLQSHFSLLALTFHQLSGVSFKYAKFMGLPRTWTEFINRRKGFPLWLSSIQDLPFQFPSTLAASIISSWHLKLTRPWRFASVRVTVCCTAWQNLQVVGRKQAYLTLCGFFFQRQNSLQFVPEFNLITIQRLQTAFFCILSKINNCCLEEDYSNST